MRYLSFFGLLFSLFCSTLYAQEGASRKIYSYKGGEQENWQVLRQENFTYYPNGQVHYHTIEKEGKKRDILEYDLQGRIIQELVQNKTEDQWTNLSRFIYQYGDSSWFERQLAQRWQALQWENNYQIKQAITWDSNIREKDQYIQQWQKSAWVDSVHLIVRSLPDERPTFVQSFVPKNGEWQVDYHKVWIFNSFQDLVGRKQWVEGQLILDEKWNRVYTIDKRKVLDNYEKYDFDQNVWVQKWQRIYQYDIHKRVEQIIHQEPGMYGWVDVSRELFYYNDAEEPVDIQTQIMGTDGKWLYESRVLTDWYNYSAAEKFSESHYIWNGQDWQYEYSKQFEYGDQKEKERHHYLRSLSQNGEEILEAAWDKEFSYDQDGRLKESLQKSWNSAQHRYMFYRWTYHYESADPIPTWQIQLYPNPGRTELQIASMQLASSQISHISFVNIQGQSVYEWPVLGSNLNQQRISIGHLPSGMYLVRVFLSNGESQTLKWRKE